MLSEIDNERYLAMPLQLPRVPKGFEQIGACLMLEADARLLRWVNKNETSCVAKIGPSRGWAEIDLDASEKRVHLHIEISRDKPEGEVRPLDEALKVVEDFIDKVKGTEAAIRFRGLLPVRHADIPETSSIGRLMGFSRQSCGVGVALTRATLSIEDEVFTSLVFTYDSKKEKVFVTLWAATECELSTHYMDDLAELMEAGAGCFVFERVSRESSHA